MRKPVSFIIIQKIFDTSFAVARLWLTCQKQIRLLQCCFSNQHHQKIHSKTWNPGNLSVIWRSTICSVSSTYSTILQQFWSLAQNNSYVISKFFMLSLMGRVVPTMDFFIERIISHFQAQKHLSCGGLGVDSWRH